MTPAGLEKAFRAEFVRRKFVAGLLLAFIRFLRQLDAHDAVYPTLAAFFAQYPPQTTTAQGKTANTLIVLTSEVDEKSKTLSLRPFYNDAERYFRAEMKRFDYPNCAPHATQAWHDYKPWLESLLRFSPAEVERIEKHVIQFVLAELPSHEVDAAGLEPLEQRFAEILKAFDFIAAKGEPPGAAFQGVIYAYIRADAPHLHLDISKVGAGSKRLQRVGDIDGWEGERLVLSVEVKHFALTRSDVPDLEAFAHEVSRRKAMGIVAATSFGDEARLDLEGQGLRTLDSDDLVKIVELWDPLKQRAAVNAFSYYAHHVEKNSVLMQRLRVFIDSWTKSRD